MNTVTRALLAVAVPCLLFGQASNVGTYNQQTGKWVVDPFNDITRQINERIVTPVNASLAGKAGLAANNGYTGFNDFSFAYVRLPESYYAALPAASAMNGRVVVVLDATESGRCDSGGGVYRSLCRSNGAVWEAIGGGGGGSATFSTIGGSPSDNAALAAVLAAKQNALTTGTAADYIDGTLSPRRFPTIPTISGAGPLKGYNGNAIAATATDVAALWDTTSGAPYMRIDGTTGDPAGSVGTSPSGAVGSLQKNGGGGAFVAAIPGTDYIAPDDSRLTNQRTPTAHASTHATGQGDAITPAAIGAVPTSDARLGDARVPLAHAISHKSGGTDPIAVATATPNAIPMSGANGKLAVGWMADLSTLYLALAQRAAANGVSSLDANAKVPYAELPTGTVANTVAAGDDSRFTNARTPTAHAASHMNGGGDPISSYAPSANAIPKAGADSLLAEGWLPSTLTRDYTFNGATNVKSLSITDASKAGSVGLCPAGDSAHCVSLEGAAARQTDLRLKMPTGDPGPGQTIVWGTPVAGVSQGVWGTTSGGHTQNTDTGTNQTCFQLASGVKLCSDGANGLTVQTATGAQVMSVLSSGAVTMGDGTSPWGLTGVTGDDPGAPVNANEFATYIDRTSGKLAWHLNGEANPRVAAQGKWSTFVGPTAGRAYTLPDFNASIVTNNSVTGANPSGACAPLTDFKIRTDVTPSTQWRCSVSGTWRQILDTDGASGFGFEGAPTSLANASGAGKLNCGLDSTYGFACKDSVGAVTYMATGQNPVGAFFSNGGSAIAANDTAFFTMTRSGTLVAVHVAADAAVSFKIDKAAESGNALPSFSAAWSGGTALTGTIGTVSISGFTTTAVNKGDILAFRVTTPGTATKAAITLEVR